jgi:type I pantothenate kinase
VAQYEVFAREAWAARAAKPAPELVISTADEKDAEVAPADVAEVYRPLAELVGTRADGSNGRGGPYVVSVVGSVAVGKSTTARALRAVLAQVPPGTRVDVVSTDGFLFSNRELAARGLTERKGFPESYDLDALLHFLDDVRSGRPDVRAPLYSHVVYDVTSETQLVSCPDVLILEGMPLANDRVDLSVFLDAAELDIEQWYVARFVALCQEAREDDASFFRQFSGWPEAQSVAVARSVWHSINAVNLHDHILPARDHCDVILEKGADHAVRQVRLRID